jgi:hypothetical protein
VVFGAGFYVARWIYSPIEIAIQVECTKAPPQSI